MQYFATRNNFPRIKEIIGFNGMFQNLFENPENSLRGDESNTEI